MSGSLGQESRSSPRRQLQQKRTGRKGEGRPEEKGNTAGRREGKHSDAHRGEEEKVFSRRRKGGNRELEIVACGRRKKKGETRDKKRKPYKMRESQH